MILPGTTVLQLRRTGASELTYGTCQKIEKDSTYCTHDDIELTMYNIGDTIIKTKNLEGKKRKNEVVELVYKYFISANDSHANNSTFKSPA